MPTVDPVQRVWTKPNKTTIDLDAAKDDIAGSCCHVQGTCAVFVLQDTSVLRHVCPVLAFVNMMANVKK